MNQPNLFDYATSELSQDAALCWLLAWARPDYATADPALFTLAQQFIELCFAKTGKESPGPVRSLTIERQPDRIDILVTINDGWWLLIEDKAGSQESTHQLPTYLRKQEAAGRPLHRIAAVYVQTGEQSNYDNVRKAGFEVITRPELLTLLAEAVAAGSANAILQNFYTHLERLETQYQAFQTTPLVAWDDRAWRGFFSALKLRLGTGDWNKVRTPGYGFYGFWWNWLFGEDSEGYLQLEYGRLCFKLGGFEIDWADRVEYARRYNARVVAAGRELGVPVTKPGRYRAGETMTAAIFPEDYRATGANGLLDMEATLATLAKARQVLSKVFGQ